MSRAMQERLADWAVDDAVKLVVIDGAGERAFSAGGDVRALYRSWQAGRDAERIDFYRDEYRLNAFIKRYPKPYVALIDRSEEHTSELQSLMRISYAVFCLKKKNKKHTNDKQKRDYTI